MEGNGRPLHQSSLNPGSPDSIFNSSSISSVGGGGSSGSSSRSVGALRTMRGMAPTVRQAAQAQYAEESKFMGAKLRRHASAMTAAGGGRSAGQGVGAKGDYLRLGPHHPLLKCLDKLGDRSILFADTALVVESTRTVMRRIVVVTEAAVCLFDPPLHSFRLHRRVLLKDLHSLRLSELADNFLCLLVPEEPSDVLLVSTRKTEMVTTVLDATKKLLCIDLVVHFSNRFAFRLGAGAHYEAVFTQVSNGVDTEILGLAPDE